MVLAPSFLLIPKFTLSHTTLAGIVVSDDFDRSGEGLGPACYRPPDDIIDFLDRL